MSEINIVERTLRTVLSEKKISLAHVIKDRDMLLKAVKNGQEEIMKLEIDIKLLANELDKE